MYNTRRGKCASTGRNELLFAADLDFGVALKHDIELVLPRVRVRGMFLPRLKTIETCKQNLAASDIGLRHLLGGEFGQICQVLNDHRYYAVAAIPSFLNQGVAPLSAAFPALMFSTPLVERKSSSAFSP